MSMLHTARTPDFDPFYVLAHRILNVAFPFVLQDGTWETTKLDDAHAIGCTSVSWAPAVPPGALISSKPPSGVVRRLTSSGCDNTVKIWRCSETGWALEQTLQVGRASFVKCCLDSSAKALFSVSSIAPGLLALGRLSQVMLGLLDSRRRIVVGPDLAQRTLQQVSQAPSCICHIIPLLLGSERLAVGPV